MCIFCRDLARLSIYRDTLKINSLFSGVRLKDLDRKMNVTSKSNRVSIFVVVYNNVVNVTVVRLKLRL